jgi:hypothetical protein
MCVLAMSSWFNVWSQASLEIGNDPENGMKIGVNSSKVVLTGDAFARLSA